MDCDLNTFINNVVKDKLSIDMIKDILRKILNGINYLHDSNIIHRDMKPQNILIKYKNKDALEVRIADFGWSKLCSIIQKPNTKNLSISFFDFIFYFSFNRNKTIFFCLI
jgi:serine/threonine protein kinase